jgi:hypothetical protein
MRCRFELFVLLKQAVPLYAELRSIAQTTERSQREILLRVGTPCSFSKRVMAPMLKCLTVSIVLVDHAHHSRLSVNDGVRRWRVFAFADIALAVGGRRQER